MPKIVKPALVILSFAGYFILSFLVERHQHIPLLSIFLLLFIVYALQLLDLSNYKTSEILMIAVLLRLVVLVPLPSLSDDFYRFIWDGRILAAGHNPFQYLPAGFLGQDIASNVNQELYYKLNSSGYFTVYPPLVQFIFLISTSIFPDDIYASVLIMKLFALMAEVGLMVIMMKILRRLNMSRRFMAVYALNPLVIIEVVGNVHHEGIMLFFLLFAVYFIIKKSIASSAVMWGLAIVTKLHPLIYLPLLLRRMNFKVYLKYFLIVFSVVALFFLPLLEGLLEGMTSSLSLYFQKFEFNASLYYIIREVGYWVKGYNIIQTAGPYLGISVFFLVLIYSLTRSGTSNIFNEMTWVFVIFLVFSTTVHPWYIISLIAFSVFTGYLFPTLWSLLIFLSYSGYTLTGYEENYYFVGLEYLIVFGFIFYELRYPEKYPLLQRIILFFGNKPLIEPFEKYESKEL